MEESHRKENKTIKELEAKVKNLENQRKSESLLLIKKNQLAEEAKEKRTYEEAIEAFENKIRGLELQL